MMDALFEPPPHLVDTLKRRYSEAHRAYHTWAHIEALLRHFSAYQDLLNAPRTVLWALYWHDAVYDPASAENERDSARLLRDEARGLLPEAEIVDAVAIIEATAGHSVPDSLSADKEVDLKFFLDIDLSILGQTEEVFDAYEAAIRKEYSFVPIDMYKAGRAKILEGFLKRDRLYFTDLFHELWETKARENLKRSIVRLQ